MGLQSDHEFAPTQIARAVFPTAFRGYDQDAVRRYLSRLAAALEHQQEYAGLGELEARTPAHERVEELETEVEDLRQEIRDLELELVQRSVEGTDGATVVDEVDGVDENQVAVAEAEVPTPVEDTAFDETRAIELLGKETARVLESARSAAADILKRAETQASSLKKQAKSELAEARRRADSLVVDTRTEMDELTERLTGEAKAEAARIGTEAAEHRATVVDESAKLLADAEELAEAEQAEAGERAREVVADAETLRQQIVSEIVAERRQAQADMDRMTGARDRLALSLAEARAELDEVADALVSVPSRDERDAIPAPVGGRSHRQEVATLIDRLEADARSGDDAGSQVAGADHAEVSETEDGQAAGGTDEEKHSAEPATGSADNATEVDGQDSDAEDAAALAADGVKASMKKGRSGKNSGPGGGKNGAKKRNQTGQSSSKNGGAKRSGGSKTSGSRSSGQKGSSGRRETAPVEVAAAVEGVPVADGSAPGDVDGEALVSVIGGDEVAAVLDGTGELNELPADGEALSLVEGFTTIELNEIDLRDDVAPGTEDGQGDGDDGPEGSVDVDDPEANPALVHSVVVNEPQTPEDVITTVASRTATGVAERTQGDLVIDRPFTGRLVKPFAARDVALTRSGPNFRRQLRRALNDDQSEVLDRLRAGRGDISVDELPAFGDQIDRYLAPLRRGLSEIAQAGATAGGSDDLSTAALDNLVRQLARYIVDRVRVPTVEILEADTDGDRERILEPIRALYRDFRNAGLADLSDDALYEAFAIGLYDAIEPSAPVSWAVDPRTDPDPVCDINRQRDDVVKGDVFPSGHARPLALPGCRCLVLAVD